jgi:uncharacterized cupin superfamily protein
MANLFDPEEMLMVIAGTPSLRTLGGERVLESGDVVSFPRGEEGVHQSDEVSLWEGEDPPPR